MCVKMTHWKKKEMDKTSRLGAGVCMCVCAHLSQRIYLWKSLGSGASLLCKGREYAGAVLDVTLRWFHHSMHAVPH